jgi:hypothetical protein
LFNFNVKKNKLSFYLNIKLSSNSSECEMLHLTLSEIIILYLYKSVLECKINLKKKQNNFSNKKQEIF